MQLKFDLVSFGVGVVVALMWTMVASYDHCDGGSVSSIGWVDSRCIGEGCDRNVLHKVCAEGVVYYVYPSRGMITVVYDHSGLVVTCD